METGNKVALTLAGCTLALLAAMRYQQASEEIRVINRLQAPVIEKVDHTVSINVTEKAPYYNFSVVPNGVDTIEHFCDAVANDPSIGEFNCGAAHEGKMHQPEMLFMTFRKAGKVTWTRKPVLVKAGERIYTDGFHTYLARCANQIRFTPMEPSQEVDTSTLEVPVEHATTAGVAPLPELPALPPTRNSVPVSSVGITQQSSSSSKWGIIAAVPVLIYHGGHTNSPSVPPPPSHCDPIEYGCN
jgi:hypothetical protein